MIMRRTNIFKLKPTKEQERKLFESADNCSKLWNEINYKRRQSFFKGKIDWNTDKEYNRYKRLIGSATAQQIIIKNNEAWRSFFALLKLKQKGRLPSHIQNVRPPRYWKDRKRGKRILRILIRNDCYSLSNVLKLPFGLKIKWQGKNKWRGKQGRLEIIYDDLSGQWYAFQPVEVQPLHQPIGDKKAYCDLGVRVLIMAEIDGKITGYSGNPLLADWWYWTKKIAKHQSRLKKVNGKHTSRQLRRLYRKRQRRFRHSINTIVSRFVELCYNKGVSEIVVGDLNGIRKNRNNSKCKKANSMIHNFWSHKYLVQRIKEKAEEYGIKVTKVNESYTSSVCPRCHSRNVFKRKRLFKCLDCKLEAHRDAVGCVNIRLAQLEKAKLSQNRGAVNGAVASPLLLRINDASKGKSPMWMQMRMKSLEPGTSHALA